MSRRWAATWLTVAAMTLAAPMALIASEEPTDTQFDVASFFAGLSLPSDGGSVSSAFRPVPEIVPSTQGTFEAWMSTLHTDDPSQQALVEELRLLCEQPPPPDYTFATAVCSTADAVDDLFVSDEPPVVVVAENSRGWNLGQGFQLTIIGIDIARDVYDGPEGDPNTGNNTGFDLFWAGDVPALGLTTYDSEGFGFVPFESGIALIENPGWIAYLLPGALLQDLDEVEVWINDGGWDQAASPEQAGSLFFGPSEFVTSSITETSDEGESDEESAPEPQPEADDGTQDEQEPPPVDEDEPETQPEATPEEEPESADEGLPVPALVGGGIAMAAATGGVVYATRRRRGKCDEVLATYDEAYEAWAEASRALNLARDAFALGESAGTEEAGEALEAAEQAEQEAYDAERQAWNNYLDCSGEARAAVRTPPVRSSPSEPAEEVTEAAGVTAVGAGATDETSPDDEPATAPPPPKPEPCKENDVKDLEVLETLRGSLTLAYTVARGTEGIRSTEAEAAEIVRDLNDVGDQVSEINDAIQDSGSGAGALIADAAATVLELTARLGAGAAAAAGQMLESHRVYNFTYEEHRVVVDIRWVKFLKCVRGSWQCFYDLEVKDFHQISIPQTEEFHGSREAREKRLDVFVRKGEKAVNRDRPRFESFVDAYEVGPC